MLSKGRSDIVTTGNDLTLRDGFSDKTTIRTGANVAARVLTLPVTGADDTLVSNTSTSTLTNKTLTSPTLTTPALGVATATSINKVAITAPATGSTLTIADGKTLTCSNTLAFTGTDASSVAFGAGGTVVYTSDKLSVHAATTSAELAGVISDETGSGALVFATSPTLTTPVLGVAAATTINKVTLTAPATGSTLTIADGKTLTASNTLTFTGTDASSIAFGTGGTVLYSGGALGTPSSGTLTNATGLPIAGITGLGTGVATALAAAVTGSDSIVLSTSPSLTTPTLGVAVATSINKVAITAPATSATLTVADGKTLTCSNTLTFTGIDASSVAFGAGGTVAYTANKLSVFAATTSAELAGVISDETGSGALVLGTAPSFITDIKLANEAVAKFYEASGTGTNYIGIKAPAAVTADKTFILPDGDGSSNQVLGTNGSLQLQWQTVATDALSQYNVKVGNSGGTAAQVNTSLLGTISAEYTTATATMTIATPCVVSYASHGLATGDRIYFTTSGALPTGVSASTTYFITKVDANTFKLSTTIANVLAGTFVASSGSQSGTHTIYVGGFREKTKQYQGQYDGTTIAAGYIGEYTSAQVSGGSTTTADTWTASTGSLALTPGVWAIGYNVTLDCVSVDNLIPVFGNVVLYNGSANIDETISFIYIPNLLTTGNDIAIPMSSQTVVNVSASTTYSLKTRCNRPSSGTASDASVSILSTATTANLTNPDNSSKIWAYRIA